MFGILAVSVMGFVLASLISPGSRLLQRVGISLPLGFGLLSFMMFGLDVFGIKVNNYSLWLTVVLLLSLLLSGLFLWKYSYRKIFSYKIKDIKNVVCPISFSWIYLAGIIIYALYILLSKTLFWPVTT